MTEEKSISTILINMLAAVGAIDETRYHAERFRAQDAEKFAVMVVDPRCLDTPVVETFAAHLRLLHDLDLLPVLIVPDDKVVMTTQALLDVHVPHNILDGSEPQVARHALETVTQGDIPLISIAAGRSHALLKIVVGHLKSGKVMFLQPSGGLEFQGARVPVINIDDINNCKIMTALSDGQRRFVETATSLLGTLAHPVSFVIASPLNLLNELFTTRGSGTLLRRGAKIVKMIPGEWDDKQLRASIESAFGKRLRDKFDLSAYNCGWVEQYYRAGALLTRTKGPTYLSKFWVTPDGQGEGLGRDVWDKITTEQPAFFWRSRRKNPFNTWYMQNCDGMQVLGDWRIFWKGLSSDDIPFALHYAQQFRDDFGKKIRI